MIKVEIDLLSCKDNGECVISAPQIFSLDANGKQSLRPGTLGTKVIIEVSGEDLQSAEEAAIVCPMQAISILSEK